MRHRNINKSLQIKVRRYIEYIHEEEKKGSHRGEILINNLSINLLNEVKNEAYGRIFKEIAIFSENFSQSFLNSLSLQMKELVFAPDELICQVFNKNNS